VYPVFESPRPDDRRSPPPDFGPREPWFRLRACSSRSRCETLAPSRGRLPWYDRFACRRRRRSTRSASSWFPCRDRAATRAECLRHWFARVPHHLLRGTSEQQRCATSMYNSQQSTAGEFHPSQETLGKDLLRYKRVEATRFPAPLPTAGESIRFAARRSLFRLPAQWPPHAVLRAKDRAANNVPRGLSSRSEECSQTRCET